MTQELTDLRNSILEGRYDDALFIVDELESMSKQDKINKIKSYLVRIMVHLIKNQVEKRLNNSWLASITDSIAEIKTTNLKDNKTSYYIKKEDWGILLEEAMGRAIRLAAVEVQGGKLRPAQLSAMIDKNQLIETAENLLNLTYEYSGNTLLDMVDTYLMQLPGGEDWQLGSN